MAEPRPDGAPTDVLLLGLAVAAVSFAAPIIREASLPALAVAMWRNALALPALVPAAVRRPRPSGRDQRLIAVAGVLLALHFAAWIPSLSYTSVASSVALVASQPVWAAFVARRRGEEVTPRAWTGITVALVGVVVLTGVDVSISTRALFGDLLALAGGALAAAYVTVGADVRQRVDTSVYATGCYSVAAVVLLVVCVVARQDLWGYEARQWWLLAALTVSAQLLGHTLVNRVLRALSATAVSVAILFEIVGATLVAAWWFGETPPLAAVPAGILIGCGVVLVIGAHRAAVPEGAPLG